MIFSIKPQIFELKCVFSYFRLKTHITLLLPVYVHSWEQRKLGELGTITTGSTPSTSIPDYYSDDGIVWVTPTDICENITFESARKLSDLGQQVGRVVPKNTILVTYIASIGKNTMLGNTGSFNQQINGLTPNENECDPYFLLTESALWSAKMKSSAAAGTMQIVNRTEFSELKTWLPSLIEQQAISDFFRQLDNLITLHQCKCQIDGCRFQSPLAITWEQRKVTEIGKIYIGLVTTMTKHYTDEGTLLIRNSDIKDGKFEFGDNPIYLEKTFAEKNETRMHQIGDVITVHTGDVGTSAVITENEAKSIGFATIVTRPNPKIIDSNYLCSFLNTDKHKKWAVSISTGDGRTNYNLGDYFELVVPVPSIAEQKKIASYIQKLNRLITLHQCE